jgi:hypothetical protein
MIWTQAETYFNGFCMFLALAVIAAIAWDLELEAMNGRSKNPVA